MSGVVWVQSCFLDGVINLSGFTVTAILINGASGSAALSNLGAFNAGGVIGALTVTTSPPGGVQNTGITIGGTDAAKFSVTNGGIVPCNLIAAVNITAGSYNISLSCT